MDTSEFSDVQLSFPDAELLPVGGSTCDCYRVKLYGKLHFMKRLKPELRTDPRYVSALQKEFETGYRLDHPHLVRYVSKGDDYLLTEYVDGITLGTFVAENPDYFKSVRNTNKFLTQLLDVVGYLHQHQVIHLDLKPSNILMTRIGHDVKLADLGYCYTDTYTDTMGRTDKYAALEQIHGEQVDARTDIYAIGKILETLPLPSIYNKVKTRCTAEDPQKRYQSVEELQSDLQHSSRPWLIGIGVLLVIAILVGLYFMPQKSEPQTETQTQDTIVQPIPPVKSDSVTHEAIPSAKPEVQKDVPSSNQESSSQESPSPSDKLKADIEAAVLPKFNETLGALPDSVRPGTEEWAQAGWALERELSNTLQQLILSHQDIPMQTIAQEFNAYLQSLITLKYNQNSQTQ
jgi:serine/threonine protein kinase